MKKIFLLLIFCGTPFVYSQTLKNTSIIIDNSSFILLQQKLLQDWINQQKIIGKLFSNLSTNNNQIISLDNIKKTMPDSFKNHIFRIVKPGMILTMDYSYQRINIELDNKNIIINIYIG